MSGSGSQNSQALAPSAAGVVLPVLWSDVAGILFAAILVGGTFMVTTMVAIEEGRHVGGVHAKELIAAMTAAFAAGQIIGPIAASLTVSMTGDLSVALLTGGVVLIVGAAGLLTFQRERRSISSSAEEET